MTFQWNGTAGNDTYTYTGSDNFIGYGLAGNDTLYGSDDDDTLWGGYGNDEFLGGEGNDTLYAGWGSDKINGGADSDTVILRGARSDYSLLQADDHWVVTDQRAGSPDGTDQIGNVEFLKFTDQTVDLGANQLFLV